MTASPILKSESVNNIFSFNESALPNGLQNALHSTTLLKTAAKSGNARGADSGRGDIRFGRRPPRRETVMKPNFGIVTILEGGE